MSRKLLLEIACCHLCSHGDMVDRHYGDDRKDMVHATMHNLAITREYNSWQQEMFKKAANVCQELGLEFRFYREALNKARQLHPNARERIASNSPHFMKFRAPDHIISEMIMGS